MNLRTVSDADLLEQTKQLARREQAMTVEVIAHLEEVNHRRLFAREGYATLFAYATQALGYSEPSAMQRISAMRLTRDLPEARAAMEQAKLSLTTAAAIQRFVQREERETGAPMGVDAKAALVERCQGRSTREVERALAAQASTPPVVRPDRTRVIGAGPSSEAAPLVSSGAPSDVSAGVPSAGSSGSGGGGGSGGPLPAAPERRVWSELRFVVEEKFLAKLERAREIRGPDQSLAELLGWALEAALDRHDPLCRAARQEARRQAAEETRFASTELSRSALSPPSAPPPPPASSAPVAPLASSALVGPLAPPQTAPACVSPIPPDEAESRRTASPTQKPTETVEKEDARTGDAEEGVPGGDRSRHIPAPIRHAVMLRSGGRCEWVEPRTGRRCEGRSRLELDHIHPFARGGAHTVSNIRVACHGHNALAAIQVFGAEVMDRYLRGPGNAGFSKGAR